jgi:transcription elongation GreA/GreB family factor
VTLSGLKAMAAARAAYYTARQIEDLNQRRAAVSAASRDMRYFAERLRTAQLIPDPVERDTVAFGSRAAFARDHGRRQTFRIVWEDEADSSSGIDLLWLSVARTLIGKAGGDRVVLGDQGVEVLSVE